MATHSLLQYSLSQSRLSTAGFVHPARTQILGAEEEDAGATLTSISIYKIKMSEQFLSVICVVYSTMFAAQAEHRMCYKQISHHLINNKFITSSEASSSVTTSFSPVTSCSLACSTCNSTGVECAEAATVDEEITGLALVAVVTIIGADKSECKEAGTIFIWRGGGGVAVTATELPTPPWGLGWRGGGACVCTICCRRGGGGVPCICCSGGGCRPADCCTLRIPAGITVTMDVGI